MTENTRHTTELKGKVIMKKNTWRAIVLILSICIMASMTQLTSLALLTNIFTNSDFEVDGEGWEPLTGGGAVTLTSAGDPVRGSKSAKVSKGNKGIKSAQMPYKAGTFDISYWSYGKTQLVVTLLPNVGDPEYLYPLDAGGEAGKWTQITGKVTLPVRTDVKRFIIQILNDETSENLVTEVVDLVDGAPLTLVDDTAFELTDKNAKTNIIDVDLDFIEPGYSSYEISLKVKGGPVNVILTHWWPGDGPGWWGADAEAFLRGGAVDGEWYTLQTAMKWNPVIDKIMLDIRREVADVEILIKDISIIDTRIPHYVYVDDIVLLMNEEEEEETGNTGEGNNNGAGSNNGEGNNGAGNNNGSGNVPDTGAQDTAILWLCPVLSGAVLILFISRRRKTARIGS